MADPDLEYRIWQRAAKWHWELDEVRTEIRQSIASGVADSARAARIAALEQCLQYLDRHPEAIFHLHGSGASDTEGQEFPNDEAARQEAMLVARELSRNRTVSTNERLVVTNAKGETIHEEPLVHRSKISLAARFSNGPKAH